MGKFLRLNYKRRIPRIKILMQQLQWENSKEKISRENSKGIIRMGEFQYGRIWEKFNGKTPMEQRTMEKSNAKMSRENSKAPIGKF